MFPDAFPPNAKAPVIDPEGTEVAPDVSKANPIGYIVDPDALEVSASESKKDLNAPYLILCLLFIVMM